MVWRLPKPFGPKGTFGPMGVDTRHTVRQGLRMAGREVEVFVLDCADERIQEGAVAGVAGLLPVLRGWPVCGGIL